MGSQPTMTDLKVPPYVEALSGGVGASLANVLIYPLDLVAARIQTKTPQAKAQSQKAPTDTYGSLPLAIQTIYRSGGLASFYQGLASDTLSTALSSFLYFYLYSALHKLALIKYKNVSKAELVKGAAKIKFTAIEELIIGSLAGIVSRLVTTPLSTITVRKQTASKMRPKKGEDAEKAISDVKAAEDEEDEDSDYAPDSSLDIAKDIYESHGLTGFWRGYKSACVLTINPAITFYLIEAGKRFFVPARHRSHPTPAQIFLISATSSAIASAVCYPLILAKTRLQWKSPTGKLLYRNMTEVFVKTVKRSGVEGLYAGLQAQLIKGFLAQGVTMVLKQRTELFIVLLYRYLWQSRAALAH